MNKDEILKERERLAEEVHEAYFNAEEINGISPQTPDNACRIGFDAAIALMLKREKILREALERIKAKEGHCIYGAAEISDVPLRAFQEGSAQSFSDVAAIAIEALAECEEWKG